MLQEILTPLAASLVLAHLLADFPLQLDSINRWKMKAPLGLLPHIAIYTAVTALTLRNPLYCWPMVAGLTLSHFIIDLAKTKAEGDTQSPLLFLVDQVMHVLSVLLLAAWGSAHWGSAWSALPAEIIYPALLYASLLGAMVFLWVWANRQTICHTRPQHHLIWMQRRLLRLSQQAGMPLVLLLVSFRFLA
jgi:hypothetical protein